MGTDGDAPTSPAPASTPAAANKGKGNQPLAIGLGLLLLLALLGGGAYWMGTQQGAVPTLTPPAKQDLASPDTPTPAPFSVTGVTAAVSPTASSSCPQTYNFSASITANGAGAVTYKWERSDGAGAPTESVTFASAGTMTVANTWTRGVTTPAGSPAWERVHVLTPNDVTSNKAEFTQTCP